MARRLLSARRGGKVVALGLALVSCQHHDKAAAPASSASAATIAAGNHFALEARALHFAVEKRRATEIWHAKPGLPECTQVLHETGDAELCSKAATALTAIEELASDAPTERIVPTLADGSLALARLSQRARYQSLVEVGQHRVTGDAGAPLAASAAPVAPEPARPHLPHPVMELGDGPAAQLVGVVLRLERDSLRNLSAYLEYAPLPDRRAAFDAVKQLRATRPQWQPLDHLIHEAMLLESDPGLKRDLSELFASGLPRGSHVGQPTVSK
ncbi:MAG: hypothetical protein ABI488_14880 [Polyangiaceae bacterium]